MGDFLNKDSKIPYGIYVKEIILMPFNFLISLNTWLVLCPSLVYKVVPYEVFEI